MGSVAWTAEADDRHEGVFSVWLAAADGVTPDEAFQAQLDPLAGSSVLADGAPGDPAELAAERDAKLAALTARFTLRVTQSLAALCVRAPVGRVRLNLRRRKEARELVLRLPAGAHALDAPCCDGCLGLAPRPAVCDDWLHLLCEACARAHREGSAAAPARPGRSADARGRLQTATNVQRRGCGAGLIG